MLTGKMPTGVCVAGVPGLGVPGWGGGITQTVKGKTHILFNQLAIDDVNFLKQI